MEFQSQPIGPSQCHGHDAPQKVIKWFVGKTKMDGRNANGGRIVAFLVQDAILLARNVLDALGSARPDQKDDPLLLALDVFGRGHPKIKIGLEAHKGIVLGAHVADNVRMMSCVIKAPVPFYRF